MRLVVAFPLMSLLKIPERHKQAAENSVLVRWNVKLRKSHDELSKIGAPEPWLTIKSKTCVGLHFKDPEPTAQAEMCFPPFRRLSNHHHQRNL